MIEVNLWAEKYFDTPQDRKELLREVKRDKAGFINTMTKKMEEL